jgi:hypothetical protein
MTPCRTNNSAPSKGGLTRPSRNSYSDDDLVPAGLRPLSTTAMIVVKDTNVQTPRRPAHERIE